jgi:hypothetical protein
MRKLAVALPILACAAANVADFAVPPAAAQVPDPHTQAIDLITHAANEICGKVELSGRADDATVQGEIGVQLGGLKRLLPSLGGDLHGEYRTEHFENVLRKDLPEVYKHGTDCRKWVVEKVLPILTAKVDPPPPPLPLWPVDTGEPAVDDVHRSLNGLPPSFTDAELAQRLTSFFDRQVFEHAGESNGPASSLYSFCRGELLLERYFPRIGDPRVQRSVGRATENLIYLQKLAGRAYGPNFRHGELCAKHSQTLDEYERNLPPLQLNDAKADEFYRVLTEARRNLFDAAFRRYP